jgi:pimeloyl-ACP methyl ester carboxylesterase
LADRLILCPSTRFVDPGNNRREIIFSSDDVEIEAWVSSWGDFESAGSDNRLVVLKVPGTGGRAERASVHPCELLEKEESSSRFKVAEVWTLNHRGYGGSTGPASIQNFVATIESFWQFIESRYPQEKKLAVGNSLGCISVLYLASRKKLDAILVRNPPPLARMIADRPKYNWWNFGMAKHVADVVPSELDGLSNASQSSCPALMITSERDRVVPPKYQNEIMDHYAGEKKQFIIDGADHHHKVSERQAADYIAAVQWLFARL